jgi:hypothetical protein
MKAIDFKAITVRQELSSRGGGVEINLSKLGFKGHKMAAYQNYLGGGMLGSIMINDTIRSQVSNVRLQLMWSSEFKKLDEIGEQLKMYMHDLTNDDSDEWEGSDYESNQTRPERAY